MATTTSEEDFGAEAEEDTSEEREDRERLLDLKKAVAGGAVAALLTLGTRIAAGGVGPWEAEKLLESLIPTTRFLCSAVMTASATILALLLTLISVSHASETTLRATHYKRVKLLAKIDTAGFIAATIVLLLVIMPLGASDNVPREWYTAIYYTMVVANAIIGGLVVTIVLKLYATIADVVQVVGLQDEEHPLFGADD